MITTEVVMDIAKDTIYTIIISSAPLLLISLVVGLVISILQTATSIQEQTLTFVPKVICIFLAIMYFGTWILNNIVEFMVRLWSNFSTYLG
jgi:flagellar biosynthetic protein FliQ